MSHKIPEQLKYTKEHEWVLVDGETVTVGITDFAQSSLGDIVFVELPEVGSSITSGSAFGVVESIKSVSDLYAPVSGEVLEVNSSLVDSPELCNNDAYEAWMIKVKCSEMGELLDATQYAEHCTNS